MEGHKAMVERIISSHAGYSWKGRFINAYLARPTVNERRPGIILLSAMWGLNWTQKGITRTFARAGFVALSPDFLHGQLPKDQAAALLAKTSLDIDQAVEEIVAGAQYLRKLPWVEANGKLAILGFCLGGGLALLALGRTREFQAGVIYHHSLFPDPQELRGISCKILCHYGTEDRTTPREEVELFKEALEKYGKKYEIVLYKGMGHGFIDSPLLKDSKERRKAAAESLARTYKFLREELFPKSFKRRAARPGPGKGRR